jgi:hypothetical protein
VSELEAGVAAAKVETAVASERAAELSRTVAGLQEALKSEQVHNVGFACR